MRPDITDDKVDIVLLDQLIGLLLADIGFETVILHDQFNIEFTHLVADVFKRQLD